MPARAGLRLQTKSSPSAGTYDSAVHASQFSPQRTALEMASLDGMMASKLFAYAAERDGYRCPQGQLLAYATTDRSGYRHYKSNPAICRSCPLLASCTLSRHATRRIVRGQATPPPPLGPLSRPPRRDRPVLARRRPTKHHENGPRPGSQAHTGLSPTTALSKHLQIKTPPKIDGVCQKSEPGSRRAFAVRCRTELGYCAAAGGVNLAASPSSGLNACLARSE